MTYQQTKTAETVFAIIAMISFVSSCIVPFIYNPCWFFLGMLIFGLSAAASSSCEGDLKDKSFSK